MISKIIGIFLFLFGGFLLYLWHAIGWLGDPWRAFIAGIGLVMVGTVLMFK